METENINKVESIISISIQVICAEYHTYVLLNSPSKQLYYFGSNICGQSGLRGYETQNVFSNPRFCDFKEFEDNNIDKIITGGDHCFIQSNKGFYGMGANHEGQLGMGEKIPTCQTEIIYLPNLSEMKIKVLIAGYNHNMCLTEDNKLYSWGNNQHGQLGLSNTTDSFFPKFITFSEKFPKPIKKILLGQFFNIVILEENIIYVWGRNDFGQLGLGDTKDRFTPTPLEINIDSIKFIECGYDHTILITEKGSVYVWGYNEFGQLGTGDFNNVLVPTLVNLFEKKNESIEINSLFCYSNHTAILTSKSQCFIWGSNFRGELCAPIIKGKSKPAIIKSPNKKQIIWIGGGLFHTFLVTKDFEIFSCGNNKFGQLGLGDKHSRDQFTPILLLKFTKLTKNIPLIDTNNQKTTLQQKHKKGGKNLITKKEEQKKAFIGTQIKINENIKEEEKEEEKNLSKSLIKKLNNLKEDPNWIIIKEIDEELKKSIQTLSDKLLLYLPSKENEEEQLLVTKLNKLNDIFIAIKENNLDLIKQIIQEDQTQINLRNLERRTPLFVACIEDNEEIIKLILINGAKVNKSDNSNNTPLHYLCGENNIKLIKLLITKNVEINKRNNYGETCLFIASENGNLEIIELLIDNNADLNIPNNDQITPLNIATQYKHLEIIKFLINKGADINKEDTTKITPLYISAQKGFLEIVELLITKKVEINKSGPHGMTPLFIACQNQKLDIVEILLSNGGDLSKMNNSGNTILQIVCKTKNKQLFELLLHYNPDLNLKNNDGIKIIDIIQGDSELKQIYNDMTKLNILNGFKKIKKDNTILLPPIIIQQKSEKIKKETYEIISSEEFSEIEEIGHGSHSIVYKATWNHLEVAIKKLKSILDNNSIVLNQEISILQKLRHPNIITLYGISNYNGFISLILEYLPKKTLYYHLHEQHEEISFAKKLDISKGIALALSYIHNLNPKIIHRDLKSENILLDNNWKAKIADFGIAKYNIETQILSEVAGTPNWMCPEAFTNNILSEKVDVYSFGMILYELISHQIPFFGSNINQIATLLGNGERPIIPETCDLKYASIIRKCWQQKPKDRPKIHLVLVELESILEGELEHEIFSNQFDYTPDFKSCIEWNSRTKKSKALFLELNPTSNSLIKYEYNNICQLLTCMHGTNFKFIISKSFAVSNPLLNQAFFNRYTQLQTRFEESPDIFFKKDWLSNKYSTWRQWILDHLTLYTNSFNYNVNNEIKIIPVFHIASSLETAYKICETGFSALSLSDEGWFGKGIYFTTNLKYALQYHNNDSNEEKIIILAYILLGNIFPVIESPLESLLELETLKGKSGKSGYDSHFTIVNPKSYIPCQIIDPSEKLNMTEIVIFQENHIFIKNIIVIKKK